MMTVLYCIHIAALASVLFRGTVNPMRYSLVTISTQTFDDHVIADVRGKESRLGSNHCKFDPRSHLNQINSSFA